MPRPTRYRVDVSPQTAQALIDISTTSGLPIPEIIRIAVSLFRLATREPSAIGATATKPGQAWKRTMARFIAQKEALCRTTR